MGCDTKLKLPPAVELQDVARAIALLLGKPRTWTDCSILNSCKDGLTEPTAEGWVEISGISYKTSDSQPTCVTIDIKDIPSEYGDGWWFFYHFELEGGNHGMLGGSRAERIALHRRLVDIFGGSVVHQDSNGRVNYRRPSPKWLGKSNDNRQFHAKHLALWNVTPITAKEIARCEKFAAYKKGER